MKVSWRRNAQLDLAEIDKHIRQENPQSANRVVSDETTSHLTRLTKDVGQVAGYAIRRDTLPLASTPLLGRPGRVENTQELVVTKLPYIVAYQVTPSAVEILAVIHTARLWPENFTE